MAKALVGYLAGPDLQVARLLAENAALRARVSSLTAQVTELSEALRAANAVVDARLVDLVEADRASRRESDEFDAALTGVTEGAPA